MKMHEAMLLEALNEIIGEATTNIATALLVVKEEEFEGILARISEQIRTKRAKQNTEIDKMVNTNHSRTNSEAAPEPLINRNPFGASSEIIS